MTPTKATEATVRYALGLAGYSLTVNFATESRTRGRLRPHHFPRPAPALRAWPPTNIRGSQRSAVIVPGGHSAWR